MLNLNKTLLFLLIAFSYTHAASSNKAREFLSAYFGVINGKEWHLDNDCLGGEFERDLNELYQSIIKVNITEIVIKLNKLVDLEKEKCPVGESDLIYKDFKIAMRNGTLIKNSLKHYELIKIKIGEFFDSDKSMRQMGLCLGSITKMIVYGTPHSKYDAEMNKMRFNILKFLD